MQPLKRLGPKFPNGDRALKMGPETTVKEGRDFVARAPFGNARDLEGRSRFANREGLSTACNSGSGSARRCGRWRHRLSRNESKSSKRSGRWRQCRRRDESGSGSGKRRGRWRQSRRRDGSWSSKRCGCRRQSWSRDRSVRRCEFGGLGSVDDNCVSTLCGRGCKLACIRAYFLCLRLVVMRA